MFRFTIRELVLLTPVVAPGIGSRFERQRFDHAAQEARRAQAVAERHFDEYRQAYIELLGAVDREGLRVASIKDKSYIVGRQTPVLNPSVQGVRPTPGEERE